MEKHIILKKLEEYNVGDRDIEVIVNLITSFENKSKENMLFEILNLNKMMEKEMSYEGYELIFEKIKNIRHLLSEEENARLNYVLEALGRN